MRPVSLCGERQLVDGSPDDQDGGLRTKTWTVLGSGWEVRMYDRLTIEVALGTLASGGTVRQAARAAGVGRSTVNDWAHGRLPSGTGGALDAAERAAYEAAMTENMLLRAVLDDLKAAGSHPLSISNRRKCELGERLREATGLPLREVTAFLRISRSSYEYHRARLGADKYAGLRAEVRALFAEMCFVKPC